MSVELVAETRCTVGEGPLWHPDEHLLYWTDIPAGRLWTFDPATGTSETVYDGAVVGGFTLQADGALLLFLERGAVALWRRGGAPKTVVEGIAGEEQNRFNDVIADPAGRVFCGTLANDGGPARLYRLDVDGTMELAIDGVGLANGMGFTPDRRAMYFTDTFGRCIWRYDYDVETGGLSNRAVFVDCSSESSMPDGMTVDAAGDIWSARWEGSCLVRYTPDGTEVQRLSLPAARVTCPTFAGEGYQDMYITTAAIDPLPGDEGGGGLFRTRTEVGGVPEFVSRVGL